jgi:hypothetical protein
MYERRVSLFFSRARREGEGRDGVVEGEGEGGWKREGE